MKLPTDREILEEIYSRYYATFTSFSRDPDKKSRESKVFVPIDLESVADRFNVDGDIIFGRLYFYLEDKYGYKREDGSRVRFFAPFELRERHCVNFPMLASVLASLQEEHRRQQWTLWLSIASIVVATVALVV
jgi:hypothetical protein